MVKLTDSKVIFYPYIYPKSINGMLMFYLSLYFFPKNRLYLDLTKLFLYNHIVQMYFDGQFYKRLTGRGIEIITLSGTQVPPAPSEGFGFRAPPVADTARKASRCRPQVRERIAEARAENGEGAKLASLSAFKGLTEGEITRACSVCQGIGVRRAKLSTKTSE